MSSALPPAFGFRTFRPLIVALLVAGAAATAAAQERFPLTRAAPDDVFLCVAGRHNPDRAVIDQAWGEVFSELGKSGAIEEVWSLISGGLSAGDRVAANRTRARIEKLLSGVDWGGLMRQEWAAFGRIHFPKFGDFVLLSRMDKDGAKKNYDGLKAILEEIRSRAPDALELQSTKPQNAVLTTLRLSGEDSALKLTAGYRDDIVIVALGDDLLNDCLALLADKSEKPRLVESSRYRKAFEGLPEARDGLEYFDGVRLFTPLKKGFSDIRKELLESSDNEGAAALRAAIELIDAFAIVDHSASTTRTEGMCTFSDERVMLTADAKKSSAYRILVREDGIENFDKYIPTEARSFNVSQGVAWRELYSWCRDFFRKNVPEGEEVVERFDALQAELGFDVDRDLFAWLSGPSISFEVKTSNPLMGSEWVSMFAVSDMDLARDKIRAALDKINAKAGRAMGAMGGMGGGNAETSLIVSTPTKIAGKSGFHTIQLQLPMMMMMGGEFEPVWGVCDGYFFVGTSKRIVEKCLETASGKHDSIRAAKRFKEEGLMPKSDAGQRLTDISFTDLSDLSEGLQQMLSTVGMVGGMVGMAAGMNPDAAVDPQGMKIINAISSIAGKLVPAAGKLNFFQSSSQYTTFDGKAWHVRSVWNYRKPPARPAAPADNDDDWGDDWGNEDAKPKKDAGGAPGEN